MVCWSLFNLFMHTFTVLYRQYRVYKNVRTHPLESEMGGRDLKMGANGKWKKKKLVDRLIFPPEEFFSTMVPVEEEEEEEDFPTLVLYRILVRQ